MLQLLRRRHWATYAYERSVWIINTDARRHTILVVDEEPTLRRAQGGHKRADPTGYGPTPSGTNSLTL